MKTQWQEKQYSVRLEFGIFEISVFWDGCRPKGEETGYRWTFANKKSRIYHKDIEEAKQEAVGYARRQLKKAIEELEEP